MPPHCGFGDGEYRRDLGVLQAGEVAQLDDLSFLRGFERQLLQRFVNEGSGLEGLTGPFLGHLHGGQPPQFFVNQREQLLGSLRIALFHPLQDLRDFAHKMTIGGQTKIQSRNRATLSMCGGLPKTASPC